MVNCRASKRKRKGGDDKTAAGKDGKKSQAAGQAKDSKSSEKVRAKGGTGQGLQELREGKSQGWGRQRTPRAQRR